MPKIEKYVTKFLGAEVLVRSTNQPQTSFAVVASLTEFELKKILIDKMKENQSINILDIQKNLYNALVESYNSEKDIFSSYGDVVTLKRGRDDQDKDEDPSAGSNRGSKRRRSGKEVEPSKEPTHTKYMSTSSSKDASKSQPKSSGESDHAGEHGQKFDDLEDQSHQEFNTGNDDETFVQEKFYGYASNMETSKDVYPRHSIIAVTDLKLMKYFGYSHLEEIIVRRQGDQLYKFREVDFKTLRRQDIEDMLLLLVQSKLSNLNIEEWYALNVALRMFTRHIIVENHLKLLGLKITKY
nr:hypothetical protein [Tanacetum cinerariifolium]